MNRQQQIERHNKNVKDAMEAARRGEIINLTALMGGREEIIVDDIDGKEEGRKSYSDDWRVK